MIEVRQTEAYARWIADLNDDRARARIEIGNPGDIKPVGEGVSEMRIDYGPGYRVYLTQRGKALVILLCGGDKRTQSRDIAAAKARQLKE